MADLAAGFREQVGGRPVERQQRAAALRRLQLAGGRGRRRVELGLRGLVQTEASAGLKAGDWVLADPPATLAPGGRVRVIAAVVPADPATRQELPVKLD